MPAAEPRPVLNIASPYPGLRPFETHEALLFHGRETHTQELLQRLARQRFLAVVGTSGSGKSSLVRAGLLPALHRGFLAGATSRWRIAVMRPGTAPIDNLAEALAGEEARLGNRKAIRELAAESSFGIVEAARQAGLEDGESLLLVVDQFEELFRFHSHESAAEAQLFVASLLEAANAFSPQVYVVLTMRSEFLGDCTQFPGLPEALNESQYLIPRLTREQRRDAIEKPLALVGVTMAPALVQRVLYELGDDPHQLPVLQHALHRSYQRWKAAGAGGEIEYAHYQKAGTLQGALNDHAGELLAGITKDSPEGAVLVQRLFRCLTTVVNGKRVRRPTRLDRVLAVTGATDAQSRKLVEDAIRRYADPENSLLVLSPPGGLKDETMVDISHESLIERWTGLREWVDLEAECVRWYADAAEDTVRCQKGQAETWRDPKLAYVRRLLDDGTWNQAWAEWSLENAGASFAGVRAYLDRGAAEQAREREEEDREQREKLEKAEALAEAERLAAESAVARESAERAAKEEAEARALAERSRKRWLLAGLVATVALGAFAVSYYSRANQMQQDLSGALEAETTALNKVNTLNPRLDYADAQIQDAEAKLKSKPAPAAGEKVRLEKEVATLRAQRGQVQQDLFAAEAELRTARDGIARVAGRVSLASINVNRPGVNDGPRAAGSKRSLDADGLTYVWIPAGKFRMGCSAGDKECDDDESPVHDVEVRGFWMGETEVTQAAWKKVMKTEPSEFKGESLPVEQVSWEDANRYCQAVGGRLPTEAEWEYAARAGSTGARYGELGEVAWYGESSGGKSHPVKGLKANAWGLYDTLGNVWEWVADWYGPYSAEGQKDPRGPASGTSRALRGGSWINIPSNVRVSYRVRYVPTYRNKYIGFRCAGEFP